MAKINDPEIYVYNIPILLDDFLIGTRASDGKSVSFKVRDIADAVLTQMAPQTLQQTTTAGNETTDHMESHDAENGNYISREAKGERYTDSNGNTIYSEYPDVAADGDAVYKDPAKTGVQIRAMISDIPEHATEGETYNRIDATKTVVPSGLASYKKVVTESPEQFTDEWTGTKEEYDALDSLPPNRAHLVSGDLSFIGVVNEDFTTSQDADSLNIVYPDDYPTMFFVVAPLVSTGEVYIKLTSGSWMILSGTLSNPT